MHLGYSTTWNHLHRTFILTLQDCIFDLHLQFSASLANHSILLKFTAHMITSFKFQNKKFTMNCNYRISRPIRRTVIFSLEILEKNYDECILILVIYCKKTG